MSNYRNSLRAAAPGIRPDRSQARAPKFWTKSRAQGTAADTAGTLAKERKFISAPRREDRGVRSPR